MQYYSTIGQADKATLCEAVVNGLAPDGGLYMPERIPTIPKAFFNNISEMSLVDISFVVANLLFGNDLDSEIINDIIKSAMSFDIPLVNISENKYILELFHGPTLSFKDIGVGFMSRMLTHIYPMPRKDGRIVNILVATSGDAGNAVAHGFMNIPGTRVFILYPKDRLNSVQENQVSMSDATNVVPIEVRGSFDDCQAMVRNAILDPEINEEMVLTSANSVNVARLMSQCFYYFWAYAQLIRLGVNTDNLVFSVPSGNLGSLTAGVISKRMGLPVKRFIASSNSNAVFYDYLKTGIYHPRHSKATMANVMDVGDPANFTRLLDLYNNDHEKMSSEISGYTYSDEQIKETIYNTYATNGYVCDPHGAIAYRALSEGLGNDEIGIALATTHPAKSIDSITPVVGVNLNMSRQIHKKQSEKRVECIYPTISALKNILLNSIK